MRSTGLQKKKPIEVALPLQAINAASGREKSILYGHPSTLDLWLARRPLAAARTVKWGQSACIASCWSTDRPGSLAHSIVPRGKMIELFDYRAATRMSEDEARRVSPDAIAARLGASGAVLYVRNENTSTRYRPFEWPETRDCRESAS